MSIVKSEHTTTLQPMKKIIFILGLSFLLAGTTSAQQLTIDLGSDSLRVCAMEPVMIVADLSGGQAPFSVTWSDGSAGDTLWFIPQIGGTMITATVTDGSSNVAVDSVWIHAHDACVWPGDANGDGIANNLDILPIGQGFGANGPARPDAHLAWMAQPADSWNQHTSDGVDFVHSDTDGNGTIDQNDVQGILNNYLVPQSQPGVSVSSGGDGVPLYVEFPAVNFSPGDTVVASVILGTAQQPADSVYGIAFSVTYDAALFDSGSVTVEYTTNWVGTEGVDLIAVDKDFYNASQVDIGMSRTNQIFQSGYGQIATIIVTIDDIAGKTGGIEMVDFDISNVSLTSLTGQPIKVSPTQTQLGISLSNDQELTPGSWTVYPNPANDQITVDLSEAVNNPFGQVSIVDLMGREIMTTQSTSYTTDINTSGIPAGTYLLRVAVDAYTGTRIIELE